MASGRFVSYLRVSTDKQGESGLGLEAQRAIVSKYLNGGDWTLVREVVEVESGKRNDRPALDQALALCRRHKATLIVAKVDRLARNAEFLLKVHRESAENGAVFCDVPTLPEGPMGKFMLTIMAANAELEAGLISARTKAALQAAKARGTQLGGRRVSVEEFGEIAAKGRKASIARRQETAAARHADALPLIRDLQAAGATTLRGIASGLNAEGFRTARGAEWTSVQVMRVLGRRAA